MTRLRERLLAQDVRRDSARLLDVVQSTGVFANVRFDDQLSARCDPAKIWDVFGRQHETPWSTLEHDSADAKAFEAWFVRALDGTSCNEECAVSVGGLAPLPWLRISCRVGSTGILALWHALPTRQLIFLDLQNEVVVGIFEGPHAYRAHRIAPFRPGSTQMDAL